LPKSRNRGGTRGEKKVFQAKKKKKSLFTEQGENDSGGAKNKSRKATRAIGGFNLGRRKRREEMTRTSRELENQGKEAKGRLVGLPAL